MVPSIDMPPKEADFGEEETVKPGNRFRKSLYDEIVSISKRDNVSINYLINELVKIGLKHAPKKFK